MKIRVQHEDGRIETLTILGEWSVQEGDVLDRVTSTAGFEHWFDKQGYYDGWGQMLNTDPDTAAKVINTVESKRDFDDENQTE